MIRNVTSTTVRSKGWQKKANPKVCFFIKLRRCEYNQSRLIIFKIHANRNIINIHLRRIFHISHYNGETGHKAQRGWAKPIWLSTTVTATGVGSFLKIHGRRRLSIVIHIHFKIILRLRWWSKIKLVGHNRLVSLIHSQHQWTLTVR